MITITSQLLDLLRVEASRRLGVDSESLLIEYKTLFIDPSESDTFYYYEMGKVNYLLSPIYSSLAAPVECIVYDEFRISQNKKVLLTNCFDRIPNLFNPVDGIFFDALEYQSTSIAYLNVLQFTRK